MNWGNWIFVSFILFVGLIATLVTISMRQDINLVAEDYYKQEIEYQDQIERLERTKALESVPDIAHDRTKRTLVITMNQEKVEQARIHFFRPSDASKDKEILLSNDLTHEVPVAGWEPGLWKVKLSWKADGKEFYSEKSIML